jgi:hypothetical protein
MIDPSFFEEHFDKLIETTSMPEEYKDLEMHILCNDC